MSTLRTVTLLGLLTGLLLGIGYWMGGNNGVIIAFGISLLINGLSYWYSDAIVLKLYGAKEIPYEASPDLHRMVDALAAMSRIPKPRIYLAKDHMANAFATGRNPSHSAICVTQGLVDNLNKKELEGVLAHEMSHIANRDTLVSTLAATLAGAISFLARMAFWSGAGGRDSDSAKGALLGMIFFVVITPIAAFLIQLAVSRGREFKADATAKKLIGTGQHLASALQKLEGIAKQQHLVASPVENATAHLFIINPFKPGFLTGLFSTHPSTKERVSRLTSTGL